MEQLATIFKVIFLKKLKYNVDPKKMFINLDFIMIFSDV